MPHFLRVVRSGVIKFGHGAMRDLMKARMAIFTHVQWVAIPLFVAGAIVWCFSPAYPQSNSTKLPAPPLTVPSKVTARQTTTVKIDSSADIQELKDHLKEIEAKERQSYLLVLEGQRKTMDWWFSFLAVLTAVLAIFGALIPFLMGRKDRELIQQDKEQIKQLLADAGVFVGRIQQHNKTAEKAVEQTKKHLQESDQLLSKYRSEAKSGPAEAERTKEAVTAVQQDPTSDPSRGLRAAAIAASEANQSDKAYALWRALTELDPVDGVAQFNAGYWAQDIAQKMTGEDALRWLKRAGQHYAISHQSTPDDFAGPYNWGNALSREAQILAATDLTAARERWKQAGEKYEQALRIKSDLHDSANNWGSALDEEARALVETDLAAGQELWRQARGKYEQALRIKPDKHESVINWGNSLAHEARALAATDLVGARERWQDAAKKYEQALGVKPDSYEAANNWGSALDEEARVLISTDLAAARRCWQQAVEKFELALQINPDSHESAVNLAGNLLEQIGADSSVDRMKIASLIDRAEAVLLQHAAAAPGLVAYNLACVYGRRGDVTHCLHWLKVSQTHHALPDCKKLKTDKDLEPVRTSSEFVAWFVTVCPQ